MACSAGDGQFLLKFSYSLRFILVFISFLPNTLKYKCIPERNSILKRMGEIVCLRVILRRCSIRSTLCRILWKQLHWSDRSLRINRHRSLLLWRYQFFSFKSPLTFIPSSFAPGCDGKWERIWEEATEWVSTPLHWCFFIWPAVYSRCDQAIFW